MYNNNINNLQSELNNNNLQSELKMDAEYKKIQEEKIQKKLMMWRNLSEDDKRKVKEFQYNIYVEETTKENLKSKLMTDRMEEMYKKKGFSSLSLVRESDNVLIVKGVHIHNGYVSIETKEEYEKKEDFDYWTAVCRCNEDLILDLYEAEMLKQGFWFGDDGEFYKTITVKKLKKN